MESVQVANPFFRATNVTVAFASIEMGRGMPALQSSPEGMSTAIMGRFLAFMHVMRLAC